MNMTEDADLLRRYAETRAEDAFAELVRRHLNLVYSAALRQVRGDFSLAEEVTQLVFADLARKAGSLSNREVLTGWLYTSTYYAATKAVRGESRRRQREQEAHLMQQTNASTDVAREWEQLQPVLDEAMHELPESDRVAVLQRYFEGKAFPQIGTTLGLTENAARMRVERALDKLRAALGTRGVTLSGTALTLALGANAVTAAPVGLASAVVGTAITTASASVVWSWSSAANVKVLVSSLCAVSATVALWWQFEQTKQLETELTRLQSVRLQLTELKAERERLAGIAIDQVELERLRHDQPELLRLRGEVGRLRRELSVAQAEASQALTKRSTNASAVEVDPKPINIKVRLFTGPTEDLTKLGLLENSTAIFEESQMEQFLKAVRESGSLEFMGAMEVTTLSGRQAQVSSTRSVTNSEGVTTLGPILDVLPRTQEGGRTIELKFLVQNAENVSYVPVGIEGAAGLPILPNTNQFAGAIVWDGQTVAATIRIAGKPMVMLITPRLIDSVGNPIHAETGQPAAEAKSFQR